MKSSSVKLPKVTAVSQTERLETGFAMTYCTHDKHVSVILVDFGNRTVLLYQVTFKKQIILIRFLVTYVSELMGFNLQWFLLC